MTTDSAFRQMAREIVEQINAACDRAHGVATNWTPEEAAALIETALAAAWALGRDAAAKANCQGCREGWASHPLPSMANYHLVPTEEYASQCSSWHIRALTPAAVPSKENG